MCWTGWRKPTNNKRVHRRRADSGQLAYCWQHLRLCPSEPKWWWGVGAVHRGWRQGIARVTQSLNVIILSRTAFKLSRKMLRGKRKGELKASVCRERRTERKPCVLDFSNLNNKNEGSFSYLYNYKRGKSHSRRCLKPFSYFQSVCLPLKSNTQRQRIIPLLLLLIPHLSPLKPLKANIKMYCFLSPSLIDGGYCSSPHTLNSLLFTPRY